MVINSTIGLSFAYLDSLDSIKQFRFCIIFGEEFCTTGFGLLNCCIIIYFTLLIIGFCFGFCYGLFMLFEKLVFKVFKWVFYSRLPPSEFQQLIIRGNDIEHALKLDFSTTKPELYKEAANIIEEYGRITETGEHKSFPLTKQQQQQLDGKLKVLQTVFDNYATYHSRTKWTKGTVGITMDSVDFANLVKEAKIEINKKVRIFNEQRAAVIYWIVALTGEEVARNYNATVGGWSLFSGLWMSFVIMLALVIFLEFLKSRYQSEDHMLVEHPRLAGLLDGLLVPRQGHDRTLIQEITLPSYFEERFNLINQSNQMGAKISFSKEVKIYIASNYVE